MNEFHPIKTHDFSLSWEIIVYGFPEKFQTKINNLRICLISFDHFQDLWHHEQQQFIEKLSIPGNYTKLKITGNGNQTFHTGL